MTDAARLHFNGESAEQVAYSLLRDIARVEGKKLDQEGACGRDWILDTYALCLKTVWDPEMRLARNNAENMRL